MDKTFKTARTPEELKQCFPVLKELRPHLSFEDYLTIYEDSHRRDDYEIVYLENDGTILGLMGYRFVSDFVRGRHLYIDDLVTTEAARSQGLGAELLKHAERIAQSAGCKSLRLCTGVENERGVKFYETNGWLKRAYAFTKKLKT